MKIIDKLFKWAGYTKQVRGDSTSPIFSAASLNSTGLTGEGVTYKTLVDNYSSWVYTCIDKIAKTVAMTPANLFFYEQKGHKVSNGMQIKSTLSNLKHKGERVAFCKEYDIEKIRVYEHPLIELFNNPNTVDTRMTLWMNIMIRLELAGYCGIYMPKNGLGLPGELWALPLTENATLSINTDPKTIIKNFTYRDGSINQTLDRDEVLYLRYPHPGSPIWGQSPLLAQRYPYDIDNYLMQFMHTMLKNKSTFGNVFTTDAELIEEQVKELQKLLAAQYQGATSSGKPLVLHSGMHLDNTKLGTSFKDIMINEAAQYASDRLITAYGLTPANLGFIKDVNRSTAEVSDRKYYEECIKPRCMLIEEYFEKELLPRYDEGLMLDFELPNVAYRELDIEETKTDIDRGIITINEERTRRGMEPVEWGDKPWMPFTMHQAGAASSIPQRVERPGERNDAPDDNDETEESEDDKAKAHRKVIKMNAAYWTEDRKRQASDIFVKTVEVKKSPFVRAMKEHFKRQEGEVLAGLEATGKAVYSEVSGLYREKRRKWLKLNKDKWNDSNTNVPMEVQELEKLFRPLLSNMVVDVGELKFEEFGIDMAFNVNDRRVSQWLGKRLRDSCLEIEQATHDKIGEVLRGGFEEGLSVTKMGERLQALFIGFEQHRAITIARTETVSASNFADLEAVKQAGIDGRVKKFWLNEFDARDTHVAAGMRYNEATAIPINDSFEVGADVMDAPGNGSVAAENINCRCNMGFVEI